MKGHRYEDLEDIQRAVTSVLKGLTSKGCFQKWEERWIKCVRLGEEYCEGILNTKYLNKCLKIKNSRYLIATPRIYIFYFICLSNFNCITLID